MAFVKRVVRSRNHASSRESVLDTVTRELLTETDFEPESVGARRWLLERAKEIYHVNRGFITKDSERAIDSVHDLLPGRMFIFAYDAKHKATLKYWDRLPLVMPVERYGDGFLGINFHYLPPQYRFFLIDRLKYFRNNSKYDETTRIRLNYSLIRRYSRLKYAKPALHRYLYSNVRSKFLWIQPVEWDVALSLPSENFAKEQKYVVWKDSRKAIQHDHS